MMPGKARPHLISIHALHEEGDRVMHTKFQHGNKFLSTPSMRRATREDFKERGGGKDFYPRPP